MSYINGITEKELQHNDDVCFVLDTNYLLGALSSVNQSEKYFDAIFNVNFNIYIPFIVWVEFNYNVQDVLSKTSSLLEGTKQYLDSFSEEKLSSEMSEIKTKFNNMFNKNIIEKNTVGKRVSEDSREYFNQLIDKEDGLAELFDQITLKSKSIFDTWKEKYLTTINNKIENHTSSMNQQLSKLNNIIDNGDSRIIVGAQYDIEKLKVFVNECKNREKLKLFPGNSEKDLNKVGSRLWGNIEIPKKYGDMLLWLELIDYAQNQSKFKKYILVSDDTEKEDWVKKDTKELYPDLSIEFFTKTSSCIHHNTSFQFIKSVTPDISEDEFKKDYGYNIELDSSVSTANELIDFGGIEVSDEVEDNLSKYFDLEDMSFRDTIVVPAKIDGFKGVFLEENRWYSINIKNDRIPYLKYIAAYQSAPVSAVTYVAKIDRIVDSPFKPGKKMVIFEGKALPLKRPIPMGTDYLALQGPRYTNHRKLNSSADTDELFNFDDDI